MALGWNDVQRMKRVEQQVNELGLKFDADPYTWSPGESRSPIYLRPKDACLPHYSRDATIYSGTIEDIEHWVNGVKWAREYDSLLKLTNDKKRSAKEDAESRKHLLKTIKTGKLVSGNLGGKFDDAIINIDPSTYGHNDYASTMLIDLYSDDLIKL